MTLQKTRVGRRGVVAILALCTALTSIAVSAVAGPPNVLFIPIDDLNHWVGHLGGCPQARTPNIDRLAASGVAFRHAYCAAPACNPSRLALMSGLRPHTTGCYDNGQDWQGVVGVEKCLNQVFLNAGYQTFGAGKVYHGSQGRDAGWTEYYATPRRAEPPLHPTAKNPGVGGIRFAPLACSDQEMPDYDNVSYGIEVLSRQHARPFFLAVGLVKPHLPFNVPKKWFDAFPLDEIELPPHIDGDLDDVPPAGVRMAKPEGDHRRILASGRW
ncbi:MAG: sulfatase-like hydrolase/transferase [Planctomycetales bacterium]|nr:sulfatase-like hydrolase/transferase [Planctomycetales bacterium]